MTPGGITIEAWMRGIGREPSRATINRWVTAGMIKPVNILGHNFITADEDARFWRRAAMGEFAREGAGIIKLQREGK